MYSSHGGHHAAPQKRQGQARCTAPGSGGEQVPVCLPAALLVREQGAHASMPRAEETAAQETTGSRCLNFRALFGKKPVL